MTEKFDKCQHPDYELKDITTTGGAMSIFNKYGDYVVELHHDTNPYDFKEFTLNELKEALKEELLNDNDFRNKFTRKMIQTEVLMREIFCSEYEKCRKDCLPRTGKVCTCNREFEDDEHAGFCDLADEASGG